MVIDKPLGLTSADVVARMKRLLRPFMPRHFKIGHGGTLDPLATGVLPIALGEATKLSSYILDADKAYDFTIAFGASTQTDDREGAVVHTSPNRPTRAEMMKVLPQFIGAVHQRPPAYSAIKVAGERAYARARAGEAVVLDMRSVFVRELSLADPLAVSGVPDGPLEQGHLSVVCSKGTYVRSLARDLAQALGTEGHVAALRRIKAGPFTIADAISLDSLAAFCLEAKPSAALLPLTAGLDDIPALSVTCAQAQALRCGQRLVGFPSYAGPVLALCEGRPVALVSCVAGQVQVIRGLNVD